MKILATQKTELNLVPYALPFNYRFSSTSKRGTNGQWFTASGKAKIYFGDLIQRTIGQISYDVRKALIDAMTEAKADVLCSTNLGNLGKLYTITGEGIVELTNVKIKLIELTQEWEARHVLEYWEGIED